MQGSAGRIELREVSAGDVPALVAIGKAQLGVDYISDEDFIEAMEDPSEFCLVSVIDGVPCGFAICREFGPESEPSELALPACPERDWAMEASRIGLVDSVAISADAGGKGIGRMLCESCISRFREDGCDRAVSMAWVHRDGAEPIRKALTQAGFERTDLVIEGYWNQWVGSKEGHHCPYCGAPCHCFAAMWRRSV